MTRGWSADNLLFHPLSRPNGGSARVGADDGLFLYSCPFLAWLRPRPSGNWEKFSSRNDKNITCAVVVQ